MGSWFRLGALAFLCGFLFVVAKVQGSFSAWFLLDVLCIIGAMIVLVRVLPGQWNVNRALSGDERVPCGHAARIHVDISSSRFRFLPWIAVEERWKAKDGQGQEVYVFRNLLFPLGKRNIRYSYDLPPLPRGVYRSEGMTVVYGDVLGLSRWVYRAEQACRLVVLPKWTMLRDAAISGRADEETYHRFLYGRREPGRLRAYKDGDPLSRMDWKATARLDKWMIRADRGWQRYPVVLVLDVERREAPQTRGASSTCDAKMRHAGARNAHTRDKDTQDADTRDAALFEAAVTCAASLFQHLKRERVPVHLQIGRYVQPEEPGRETSWEDAMDALAAATWGGKGNTGTMVGKMGDRKSGDMKGKKNGKKSNGSGNGVSSIETSKEELGWLEALSAMHSGQAAWIWVTLYADESLLPLTEEMNRKGRPFQVWIPQTQSPESSSVATAYGGVLPSGSDVRFFATG